MTAAQIDVLAGTAEPHQRGRARPARARGARSLRPLVRRATSSTTRRCSLVATPLQSQTKVQPIALVSDASWAATLPGAPLFVTGWGSTAAGTGPDISLRGVQVKTSADTTCNDDYQSNIPPIPFDGAVQTCAGDASSGGKDSCQGDSGGPLVKADGAASTARRRAGRDRLLRRRLRHGRLPGRLHRGGRALDPGLPHARQPPCRADQHVGAHAGRSRARSARQLTCSPRASWTGAPTFSYQFVRSTDRRRHRRRRDRARSRPTSSRQQRRGHRAALRRLRHQRRRRERRLERAEPARARAPRRRFRRRTRQLRTAGQPRARRPRDAHGVHGHALHPDGDGHRRGLLRRDQGPPGVRPLDLPRQVHQARHGASRCTRHRTSRPERAQR